MEEIFDRFKIDSSSYFLPIVVIALQNLQFMYPLQSCSQEI